MEAGDGARAGYPVVARLVTQAWVGVGVGGAGLVVAVLLTRSWAAAIGVVVLSVAAMLFWGLTMWAWLRGRIMETVRTAPYVERPAVGSAPPTSRVAVLTGLALVVGIGLAVAVYTLVGDADPGDPAAGGTVVGIVLGSALLSTLQVRRLRSWEVEHRTVIYVRADVSWIAWTNAQARDRLVLVRD